MTKNLAEEQQRTARQALTSLYPTPQGEEAGGLPFRRLIAAAFRARYLVFATTLFGVLIGAFLAITTPNTYLSTGKFLFTASGAEAQRVDIRRATDTSQETIGTAATYILNTDNLLKEVVKKLGAARILAPYQPGTGEESGARGIFFRVQRDWNKTKESDLTEEGALRRLKHTVVVERPRFQDVLIATCNANNPQLAQEILATYMEEAIAYHIKQYDDPEAYEALRTQWEAAKLTRETAVRAMRDFLDRKALVTEFDVELRRLKDKESEANVNQGKYESELSVGQTIVDGLLAKLDPEKGLLKRYRKESRRPDTTAAETYYEQEVLKMHIERQESLRRGDGATAKKQQTAIEEFEKLVAERRRLASEAPPVEVMVENTEWKDAATDLAKWQQQVDVTKARLHELKESRQPDAQKLKKLLDLEPEYLQIRDAMLMAEDALKVSTNSWNAAQEKRALGQGMFSSLKKIEDASMPLEKEGPNRGKLLLGGFFVGLFLGLGIVVLRTLPDTVVRTRDDLEQIEGLAVIGIMPRLDGGNLRRHVALREQGW
jgi:uncharacterized protein involved in exopolysaccharide biosynthesis